MRFNGFLCVRDKIPVTIFARKDISWRVRKPNAKLNRFQIVTILFYFFLQHISKTLCHLCSRRFWQSTFTCSTDPWLSWADPEAGQGVRTPLKNHKNRVSKQYWSRSPEKNYKATKPAFSVGPLSARQPLT